MLLLLVGQYSHCTDVTNSPQNRFSLLTSYLSLLTAGKRLIQRKTKQIEAVVRTRDSIVQDFEAGAVGVVLVGAPVSW